MSAPALVFSLREQIANQLRSDVLSGRLPEGERLSEVDLVERFGVSRTPIREALQQLTHEGLLEGKPNSSVMVTHRPPDEIRELVVPIRRSVETFALRAYFGDINENDFRHWEEMLEKLTRRVPGAGLREDRGVRHRVSPIHCKACTPARPGIDLGVTCGASPLALLANAVPRLLRSHRDLR